VTSTSTDESADEERRRSIEALESFWWSQMRVAKWLALQQFRAEDSAAQVAAGDERADSSGR
jgi:hypothetical protein